MNDNIYVNRWLKWQSKMISDVKIGAVFVHANSSDDKLAQTTNTISLNDILNSPPSY